MIIACLYEIAQMVKRMGAKRQHIDRKKHQKEEKVFVVARSETIVDEDAVVVEFIDTAIAVITVCGALGSQILAVDAFEIYL